MTLRARDLLLISTMLAGPCLAANGPMPPTPVPSGQNITPTAAPNSSFRVLNPGLSDHPGYHAESPINMALSPDGNTLLVVTSGYNRLNYSSGANSGSQEPSASNEYVFVYDVSGPPNGQMTLLQTIQVPNSFIGLT